MAVKLGDDPKCYRCATGCGTLGTVTVMVTMVIVMVITVIVRLVPVIVVRNANIMQLDGTSQVITSARMACNLANMMTHNIKQPQSNSRLDRGWCFVELAAMATLTTTKPTKTPTTVGHRHCMVDVQVSSGTRTPSNAGQTTHKRNKQTSTEASK